MAGSLWQRRNQSKMVMKWPAPRWNATTASGIPSGGPGNQRVISLHAGSRGDDFDGRIGCPPLRPGPPLPHMMNQLPVDPYQWDEEVCAIRDVWQSNLDSEFKIIQTTVDKYPVVALKVLSLPLISKTGSDFRSQYQQMKEKVDMTTVIQLGMTLMDRAGKLPPGSFAWQFNFRLNQNDDTCTQIVRSVPKSGTGSRQQEKVAIDVSEFSELLISSGIVLNDDVICVSFDAGQDFGHLLKWLTGRHLPAEETDFIGLLLTYFPVLYDVKYLTKSCKNMNGDLRVVCIHSVFDVHDQAVLSFQVANRLGIQRLKSPHQTGADSLMIAMIFHKMRELYFENMIDYKYCGQVIGLGSSPGSDTDSQDSGPSANRSVERLLDAAATRSHLFSATTAGADDFSGGENNNLVRRRNQAAVQHGPKHF